MKVIVAGFPKTGTKTLNSALTTLGYKVYDYPENAFYYGDEWKKILTKGWSTEDFRRMYENVDAIVDIPACYFWEEIHKAFPDAKIILSMRENEDVWMKSFENQMTTSESNMAAKIVMTFSPTARKTLTNCLYPLSPAIFGIPNLRSIGNGPFNKALLKLKYRAHNAHVLQNAPDDKLLVYKVTDGWDPLCKFLKVPVPDEPFPHKNKGGEITKELLKTHPLMPKIKREVVGSLLLITTGLGIGGYFFWKILSKHRVSTFWK